MASKKEAPVDGFLLKDHVPPGDAVGMDPYDSPYIDTVLIPLPSFVRITQQGEGVFKSSYNATHNRKNMERTYVGLLQEAG